MLFLSRLLSVHIVQEAPGVQYWTWEHCAFSWTPASSTEQWQNKVEISDDDLERNLKKKKIKIEAYFRIYPAQRKRHYGVFCPRRIRKLALPAVVALRSQEKVGQELSKDIAAPHEEPRLPQI